MLQWNILWKMLLHVLGLPREEHARPRKCINATIADWAEIKMVGTCGGNHEEGGGEGQGKGRGSSRMTEGG